MNGRRLAKGFVGAAGAVLAALVVGGGWVYAGQLLPAPSRDRTLELTATVTSNGTVILPPERRACLHTFGLLLDGAFLRYGGEVDGACDGEGTVEREVLTVTEGDPVLDEPQSARFDEYIWLGDPGVRDVDHVDVVVPTERGDAEAWFVPGTGDTWVILVHGRSATREEALRVLPTVVDSGMPTLVITYRNDFAGGPDGTDGTGRFGQAEWPDLSSAIGYAQAEGAQRVVLMGFSQGGSLIGYHLREMGSDGIAGVILDSPLLDLPETLVLQAERRGIAGPLIPPILFGTQQIARLRTGFNVADVTHVDTFAALDVPTLLLHGPSDDFVPVGPSDRLAEARPDVVYERFDTAGHVEGFNAEPERYTTAIHDFLASL